MASEADIAVFTAGLLSFPDFLIQVHDFKWFVHSHVLSSKSSFFARACDGPFLESEEKRITLHDDCPFMVARLLMWLYFGHYDVGDQGWSSKSFEIANAQSPTLKEFFTHGQDFADFSELKRIDDSRTAMERSILLYHIADKYGVVDMMKEAKKDILNEFGWHPDSMTILLSAGPAILSIDEEVTDKIMKRMFACMAEDTVGRYKLIKQKFESDVDIMGIVHDTMVEQLSQQQQELAVLRELKSISIKIADRAYRALDSAENRRHGGYNSTGAKLAKILKEDLKDFSSHVKTL